MSQSRGAGHFQEEEPVTNSGKDFLFVVGIDKYQHFPPLYNAVKDAKDFIKLMLEKYQFVKERLITLFDEEATQANIIHAFDELEKQMKTGDNLVMYFSGHGEYKANIKEGSWIPVDGRENQIGTFISFTLVKQYLKIFPARHSLIIADSCYSGSFFSSGRSTVRAKEKLAAHPSRWVLTAGRNKIVADGQPGQNSPFASSLLSFLNRNEEPLISISELADFVKISVNSKTEGDQIPRGEPIAGVGHDGGEFMFRLKGHAGPVLPDIEEVILEEPETARPETTVIHTPPPVAPQPEPVQLDSLSSIKRTLKRKIGAGEFKEVFEIFYQVIKSNSRTEDDLILQEGQYNRVMRDKQNMLISDDYAARTLNRISVALNSMVGDLDEDDLKPGLFKAS